MGSRGCGSLFCDDSRNMFVMHGRTYRFKGQDIFVGEWGIGQLGWCIEGFRVSDVGIKRMIVLFHASVLGGKKKLLFE